MALTQYFNITVASPKGSKKPVSIDVTKDIDRAVDLEDEDGMIKELKFDLANGSVYMDVLSVGMKVDLIGGSLEKNTHLFSGYIKEIPVKFTKSGDIQLTVVAHSESGGKLTKSVKDVIYPSKNSPKSWATSELTYSAIIMNLAKDAGIVVKSDNIQVTKDIKAGFTKGTIRQQNMTDWAFMQFLAKKIKCTMWVEDFNGKSELHLSDDSTVVKKLSSYTFFFLSRTSNKSFIDFEKTSPKQIQIIEAKLNLDTKKGKKGLTQTTDPNTGETRITKEDEETGERWVLDEEKVRALPSEERRRLMDLFLSGKVSWEAKEDGEVSAKQYFKKVLNDGSSREGEQNYVEVEVSPEDGKLKEDGISSQNPKKENTGSTSKKTVVDYEALRKLSAEQRSGIMGRIARGEITEDDKKYYTVVDTTPKQEADSSGSSNKPTNVESAKKTKKRDAGFKITCTIAGDIDIVARKSYILEGFGKYSGQYYLYRVKYGWGSKGFLMDLIFTK
tara:strand:+ start:38483 stop:39985 length:1503 start_codon:yes stop_codon:yes gene_type:complete